ncbi:uncharacterized protein LOC128709788 [Anopheles marshallii]|uniref:uncharacterized protein LOC128709788 n=1 Tax=Anopheles marshallii TaxID=1521116 RepID=UPI00237B762F|nr:uncharacterized protein LOC128709788 [Anopheles marshallii]
MLLIILFLSCLTASPIKPSRAETIEEHVQCSMEIKECLNFVFDKLVEQSAESFELSEKFEAMLANVATNTPFDRVETQQSSSSESSSESFEHIPNNAAQKVAVLLAKMYLLMDSINRTISTSSCFKHLQSMGAATIDAAKLQQNAAFSCETSLMVCFVFRVLHWIYVEPTYEILQLLRHWIKVNSFNSGMS